MRENTILVKLGLNTIRKANHFEQSVNEYGEKVRWVVDQGERQSPRGEQTRAGAFGNALSDLGVFEPSETALARLTPKERSWVKQVRAQQR